MAGQKNQHTASSGMQAFPTGACEPLLKGSVGLLLGRSSITLQGIFVAPGLIDTDFE